MEEQNTTDQLPKITMKIVSETIDYIYSSLGNINYLLIDIVNLFGAIKSNPNYFYGKNKIGELQNYVNKTLNDYRIGSNLKLLSEILKKDKISYYSNVLNHFFKYIFAEGKEADKYYFPFYSLCNIYKIIDQDYSTLYDYFEKHNEKEPEAKLENKININIDFISIILRCIRFIEIFSFYIQLTSFISEVSLEEINEYISYFFISSNKINHKSLTLLNYLKKDEIQLVNNLGITIYKICKIFLYNDKKDNNTDIVNHLINFGIINYKDGLKHLLEASTLGDEINKKVAHFLKEEVNCETISLLYEDIRKDNDNKKKFENITNIQRKDIRINDTNIIGFNVPYIGLIKEIEKKFNIFHTTFKFFSIENDFKRLIFEEKFIVNSIFNSTFIDIEKKKIKYFERVILSLKNQIKNLINPYNYNLWRKISNIILKNIFVILKRKGYIIRQKCSNHLVKLLNGYRNKFNHDIKAQTLFEEKIENITKNLIKEKEQDELLSGNTEADKKRDYNLIIIYRDKNFADINGTLSIGFLFHLKENGNKLNNFDEEILNVVLFEDLNIFKEKIDSIFEEINSKIEEEENEDIVKIKYTGKEAFSGEELIDYLHRPFKLLKEEKVEDMSIKIENKIKEIKIKNNFDNKEVEMENSFKSLVEIKDRIDSLSNQFEEIFENKNFDKKDLEKLLNNDLLPKDLKNILEIFIELEKYKKQVDEKIKSSKVLIDDIKELDLIKKNKQTEINNLINLIKNQTKENVIELKDIFNSFKKELLSEKINKGEYKLYQNIFNESNIIDFKMTDFFHFLKDNLISEDEKYSFSIIKRDVIHFNLLIEIINDFNELKDEYNNNLDILI